METNSLVTYNATIFLYQRAFLIERN